MDPRQARDMDKLKNGHSYVGNVKNFSPVADNVEERLINGNRILIDEDKHPRNLFHKPAAMDFSSVNDMIKKTLSKPVQALMK